MRLNVDIKRELYDEFVRQCGRSGRSISDVVREIVGKWVARQQSEELRALNVRELVKDTDEQLRRAKNE